MGKRLHFENQKALYEEESRMAKDFNSRDLAGEIPSVYHKLKVLSIFGFLAGIFPVINVSTSSSAQDLSFKKCSLHFFWSMVTLFIKILGLTIFFASSFVLYIFSSPGKGNSVDSLAWFTVFMIIFSFGGIIHVLHLTRMRKLISLLRTIDNHHGKYGWSCPTRIFSKKILFCSFSSILVIVTPSWILLMVKEEFLEAIRFTSYWKSEHEEILNEQLPSTLGMITALMTLVEYGVTLYYVQLFYLGAVLRDMMKDMLEEIERKCLRKLSTLVKKEYGSLGQSYEGGDHLRVDSSSTTSTTPSLWSNSGEERTERGRKVVGRNDKGWGFECVNKSWLAISQQYLDFHDVHDEYCDFIGSSFIVLFATLTISLVCMVYCYAGLENQFLSNCSKTLLGIVVTSFLRILFLADVGETFLRKHAQMLKLLTKVQQSAHFMALEKSQFKQLFLTVRTIPVRLSAKGFFTVSRENVTSIISVIITYVIVLLQFRGTGSGVGPGKPMNLTQFNLSQYLNGTVPWENE